MKLCRHLFVGMILLSAVAGAPMGCGHTVPVEAEKPAAARHPIAGEQLQRIDDLTQALQSLDPDVSENEARDVAQSAIIHASELGRRYRIVRPPQLHNLLVKFGWKKRGLCYHWTEDLLAHLKALDLRQLHLQRVVAYRGSNLREHHSVVVTSGESSFSEGIVLDGWRHAGALYWSPVGKDRYPWVPLSAANGGHP